MTLTKRETATVLAALRYWQNEIAGKGDDDAQVDRAESIDRDGDHFQSDRPLNEWEIDTLCEKINTEKWT